MNMLFAQVNPAQSFGMPLASEIFLGAVFVMGVGLVFMTLRNHQIRREWDHAERMQGLSIGLVVPHREASWAKALICIAIGVGVPFTAFAFTYSAFESQPVLPGAIWLVPGIVSGLSVLGSTLLTAKLFGRRERPDAIHDPSHVVNHSFGHPHSKPISDPDAYDVTASRG